MEDELRQIPSVIEVLWVIEQRGKAKAFPSSPDRAGKETHDAAKFFPFRGLKTCISEATLGHPHQFIEIPLLADSSPEYRLPSGLK